MRPRDGWPNRKAVAAASGADAVIDNVRLFDSTAEAIADLSRVYATTARHRGQIKPVVTPRQAADGDARGMARGEKAGVLFGPERTGLHQRRHPAGRHGAAGAAQPGLLLAQSGAGGAADRL